MSSTTISLKNILEPAKGKDRLPVLTKLCALPSFWGEADELFYLDEARKLAGETGTADERAKAIFLLGKYYIRKANYNRAIELFHEAGSVYNETSNVRGKVECSVQLGIIDNARSLYDKALAAGTEAEIYAKGISYNKALADALLLKSAAHQCLGQFNLALDETNKSLEIYE